MGQSTIEARVTALEKVNSAQRSQITRLHLKMEDSENRSKCNNLRLRIIPEATVGRDLRAVAVAIFNQLLDRATDTYIEIDRIHRAGGRNSRQERETCFVKSTFSISKRIFYARRG